MENKERGEMEEKYFAEDLITDIIRRVPTKHLTPFTCVSKSWCSLIRTDSYFFRLQRTASLHRLDCKIRKDIREGCTLEDLDDRAAVAAREILSQYDHLNVFSQQFEEGLAAPLYRGYRKLRPKSGHYQGFGPVFTLKDLQSEDFKRLASLALDKYNKKGKGRWVLEEVISFNYSYRFSFRDCEYILHFGARSISSKDLEPFRATYRSLVDDESEAVKSVNSLRYINHSSTTRKCRRKRKIVVQIGSSGDDDKQLDGCIFVRKTRKMTYMKQGDSCDIISYRNTVEDKIGSSDEKDKQVDKTSTGINC